MKHFNLLKTFLLLCALVVGSTSMWGQTVTIWSEDFSAYSADDVPSGTIGLPHTGTSLRANGTLSYSCANGDGTSPGVTKVYDATLAGGTSPELLVGKYGTKGTKGGTFTAVIPLDNIEGSITLKFNINKQKLHVYSTTEGISGGYDAKPSEAGQQTATFTGVTSDMTSITLVFQAYSSNVRLDNIILEGTSASTDPIVNAEDVILECDATAGEISYTIDNPDGSTFNATEKSPGYDWIDGVAVDTENNKVTFTTTENTGAAREGYITLSYGSVTKDVKVTQNAYVAKYDVTINETTNGSVTADVATAESGATVTLTITPVSGYKLATITATDADENDVALSGTGNTRTFTMPAKAVTIAATFEKDYSITYDFSFDSMGSAGWGGSYASHTQEFAAATVVFSYASKQSGTITDIPVSKGEKNNEDPRPIILTLKDANATLKSASFALKHWTNKVITITMYYSTDGGENWTTTGQTHAFTSATNGESVTLAASSLPVGTNAVKLEGNADQQYAIASATIEVITKATVSSAGWATYVPQCNVIFAEGDAYVVTAASTSTSLEEVTDVKAGTPILLKGEGTKVASIVASASAPTQNLLQVSDGSVTGDDANIYVLAKKTQGVGFYLWDSTAAAIPAGKVYLDTTGASAKGGAFIGFGDETTGIESIHNTQFITHSDAPMYNLAGQQVSDSYKGIVIVNGKKVVRK